MNTLPSAIIIAIAFMPAMTGQAAPPTIPGIPEWVSWLLYGVAAYMARDIIPWLRQRLDSEFAARLEREKAEQEESKRNWQDREDRFLIAFEQSVRNGADTAAALKMLGEARIVNTFELQEMRRDIERIMNAVVPSPGPYPRRRATDRKEE